MERGRRFLRMESFPVGSHVSLSRMLKMNSSAVTDAPQVGGRTVRVAVVQPSLAAYRAPVYRELARRAEVDLCVLYAQSPRIPNVAPEGFDGRFAPIRRLRLGGRTAMWHGAQWRIAGDPSLDAVVLSWDLHYASLIPALLRAKRRGVGTVLWGHGYSKSESPWRRRLRERSAGLADALLLYNRAAAASYVDAGADPKRVFVALNSLDQSPIQAARQPWIDDPARLDRFRRDHGLDGTSNVLFVSRLQPANRLDLLVEAASLLLPTHPRLNVLIIGKGVEERQRLETIARERGVAAAIRFLGPIYGEEQLAPWFLASDVFCYPANIGLSVLHAFGYGLPVITSDDATAQNPEFEAIRHGENGLLYPPDDTDALATTLDRLLSDDTQRLAMGDAARQTVLDEFSLKRMVDGMEAAIQYAAAYQSGRG